MEKRRHGDIDMETWIHQTENGSLGGFPKSVYRLLTMQTDVGLFPFVDEETD
jgi:hypothetical protein